jgi:DNA primase
MEGYLDVARALEAGVTEAVATCGTALTAGHARLLHRFAERVNVNFDQDDAGQKAARKSLDVLIEEGLRSHVVELPAGDDPDTYVKAAGAAAYRERLAAAPEAMEWLMKGAVKAHDLSSPAGKGAYVESLLPTLAKMESAVERGAWLRRIAERGGIDEGSGPRRDEALPGRAPVRSPAPPKSAARAGAAAASRSDAARGEVPSSPCCSGAWRGSTRPSGSWGSGVRGPCARPPSCARPSRSICAERP